MRVAGRVTGGASGMEFPVASTGGPLLRNLHYMHHLSKNEFIEHDRIRASQGLYCHE